MYDDGSKNNTRHRLQWKYTGLSTRAPVTRRLKRSKQRATMRSLGLTVGESGVGQRIEICLTSREHLTITVTSLSAQLDQMKNSVAKNRSTSFKRIWKVCIHGPPCVHEVSKEARSANFLTAVFHSIIRQCSCNQRKAATMAAQFRRSSICAPDRLCSTTSCLMPYNTR